MPQKAAKICYWLTYWRVIQVILVIVYLESYTKYNIPVTQPATCHLRHHFIFMKPSFLWMWKFWYFYVKNKHDVGQRTHVCTVNKLISTSLTSENKKIQITLEGTIIMNEVNLITVVKQEGRRLRKIDGILWKVKFLTDRRNNCIPLTFIHSQMYKAFYLTFTRWY